VEIRRLRWKCACTLLAGAALLCSRADAVAHEWLPVASAVANHLAMIETSPQPVRQTRPVIRDFERPDPDRPKPLVPLYVSFVTLQALDLHSTDAALDRGSRELNPVLAPFAHNRGAALAFKAATTGATILAVEKLWKRNPAAAVITMVAANAAYALIVSHNYRQAMSGRSETR